MKTFATAIALSLAALPAAAQSTTTSPTSAGALPGSVSVIGGIVLDLIGLNGNRVVSQLAASTLYRGNPSASNNPLTIGTQTGFSASVLSQLGGGIQQLAARVSLFDGDSAPGNFDDGDNQFGINGTLIGNFSDVATVETTGTGSVISTGTGFADDDLETGFFYTDDATILDAIFQSLGATGSAVYTLLDSDPGDQFYDFTQGIDADLIDVGSGPVVTPPGGGGVGAVPLPAAAWMLMAGIGALAAAGRRRA